MSKFFDDTMQGLLEAVAIDKGGIGLIEKKDMPSTTLYSPDKEKELIDQVIHLRKELHISQRELALMTGNHQQTISRFKTKENSPSLKMFYTIVNALGYEVQLVKK